MSATKSGKRKQQTEVPEEDFEAFVRESLAQLSKLKDKSKFFKTFRSRKSQSKSE